ncbi:LPS export ABC transporter periplasmic protein LptC [Zavarzinia sp. CC-PAN008]|uniref:LPS export ABC transporter periplasmic protein LptC n=1 Tax=Zavarzinia sp. CC-PAN008 TaxID=3243332 RepID=UPI003F74885C
MSERADSMRIAPLAVDMAENRPRRSDRVERYSRFVGLMKLVLPLLALGLVAMLVIWPGLTDGGGSVPMIAGELSTSEEGLAMQHPRYVGIDKVGQPYSVTATRAMPDKADPDEITLDTPAGDFKTESGTAISLSSASGLYKPKEQSLMLEGQVKLSTSDGYSYQGDRLLLDLATGSATSQEPISAKGPAGTIRADSMAMREKGQILHFQGNVSVVIDNGEIQ